MIECSSCHTLNPLSERSCLACSAPLVAAGAIPAASQLRCPAGHPIDPSWKSCPYCSNTGQAVATMPEGNLRTTRLDQLQPPGASPGASLGPGATRLDQPPARTRLEDPAASSGRRTLLQEVPKSEPQQAATSGRLVAVLAAPELGKGGSIFPIRVGKTTLGADRHNQVVIPGDGQVSSEHAVLLYREGVFHLTDRFSTNGTWVNGREVPANGTVSLQDRDQLRLGNTQFVLLIIAPPPAPHFARADA